MKREKVLLIAPIFYEYEKEIQQELEKKGYLVDFISLHINNTYIKLSLNLVKKFSKQIYYKIYEKYYKKKIIEVSNRNKYNKIIVINGENLNRKILKELKRDYLIKKTEMYLYIWVPISRNPELLDFSKEYSIVFSFEEKDCKRYNFKFLPNFYSKLAITSIKEKNKKENKDIFFVGIYRKDRYQLKKKIEETGLNVDIILYHNPIIYYFRKFYNYRNYKNVKSYDLNFHKLNREEMYNKIKNTKCLLDNTEIGQEGLTQRVLDSLILEKKVISTNRNIITYDFYNPNNIHILDLNNLIIPSDFLLTPYQKIDKKIIERYSIENWIEFLLNKKEFNK